MEAFTCSLCPRRCGALRTPRHGEGICRMPALPMVARAALHKGEEPCISGTDTHAGSGTVFFSGCALRCAFCQNHEISRGPAGQRVTPQQLADMFRRLVDQGALNINLVNPTHYAAAIREALSLYRPPVPVVYTLLVAPPCSIGRQAVALILGQLLCYMTGVLWFVAVYTRAGESIGFATAMLGCVIPFVVPDGIKLWLALVLGRRVSRHISF